jgi:hypothetical protein
MIGQMVERDERTVSVENTSYRWAYLFLSYGLLVSVAYRGFVRNEASWDLLALVVLAGAIATFYQGSKRVLSRRWLIGTVAAVVVALVLGAVLTALNG